MNRKRLTLVVLVGVLILAMAYAYWATPRLEQAPPRTVVKRPARVDTDTAPVAAVGEVEGEVALALLHGEPTAFPGASRDIFRFHERKPIAPPPPPVVAAPPPVAPPPPPPPNPLEAMQRALAKFTFVGYLERGTVKTIFLSSAGEVYVVNEGEAFGKDKEFVVESISQKELLARGIAQSATIRVPLIENEQLSPAISAPANLPAVQRSGAPTPILRNPPNVPQRRNVRFRPPEPSAPAEEDWEQEDQEDQEQEEPDEPLDQETPEDGEIKEGGADGSNQ